MHRSLLLLLPLLALSLGCCKDANDLEQKCKNLELQRASLEGELNNLRNAQKNASLSQKIVGEWKAADAKGPIRGITIQPNNLILSMPGKAFIQGTYLLAGSSMQITGNTPDTTYRFEIINVTETELEIRKDGEETAQKLQRV
jgi:hypothetical protein